MKIQIAAVLASVFGASLSGQSTASRPASSFLPVKATQSATAAGPITAITNGRVFPVSGPAIERATVLIRGRQIAAVGASVAIPPGATVIDAAGKIVTPGFIESDTQIGIVEIPS